MLSTNVVNMEGTASSKLYVVGIRTMASNNSIAKCVSRM